MTVTLIRQSLLSGLKGLTARLSRQSVRRGLLRLAVALAGGLLGQCSQQLVGPGNSSETGNTVSICAAGLSIDGRAPRGTRVEVFSSDFIPMSQFHAGLSRDLVVDSSGEFGFDSLPAGYYNVLLSDSFGGSRGLFVDSLPLFADSSFSAGFDSLASTGGIAGTALRRNSADSALSWTYAFIAGSPFFDYTGVDGLFRLQGLPPHRYTLRFYGVSDKMAIAASELLDEADTVSVVAGVTTSYRN